MSNFSKNKKRVLVLGINCFPELTGIGKYTGEMISWLAENGYQTTMVTGFPYYPNWKIQTPHTGRFYKKETLYNRMLTLYRCPMYVPANPSGLKRLIHEATFFFSAFLIMFRLLFKQKHELTICITPPFHLGFLAIFYRFFKSGRIIYHIQDLQIDAAKNLGILKPGWIFSSLFAMEKYILNKADIISTISEGMKKKIMVKTTKAVRLFPNWVDTLSFHPIQNRSQLKMKWGYQEDDHVILYSGSIGEKQGLDCLIRIAAKFKNREKIKFVICGTGPYKRELIRMTIEEDLRNIIFLPLQERYVFNEFLNIADLHLVLQKANASDLMMPSKLTSILSVGGLALVTADAGTTLYDIIKHHEMGIVIPAENEELLAEAIALSCENDYGHLRINARKYAEEFLDKRNILPKMMEDLS